MCGKAGRIWRPLGASGGKKSYFSMATRVKFFTEWPYCIGSLHFFFISFVRSESLSNGKILVIYSIFLAWHMKKYFYKCNIFQCLNKILNKVTWSPFLGCRQKVRQAMCMYFRHVQRDVREWKGLSGIFWYYGNEPKTLNHLARNRSRLLIYKTLNALRWIFIYLSVFNQNGRHDQAREE